MKYMVTVIVVLLATVATAEDTRKWYAMAYPRAGMDSDMTLTASPGTSPQGPLR